MKNKALLCGLVVALFVAGACTSPGTANQTTNTSTTSTTSNTSNRTTPPATNTANTATSNTAAANTSNTSSTAGAAQDFTLVNATGVEIDKLYISPHGVDDWEEDILGRDTLPSGESVDIKFNRSEKAPLWDLRVEDSKGNAIEWENLNLLEISKVTLHYENGKGTAQVE
ncbi:MAG TPA: hypothetical protein VGX92_13020 [Pyrinomonadaceae bacterium]|jgi:hypothetical protein|nr:hypothetical protein [Pyrinomonadaceae bacterium]